jgi:hypothetical protein
MARLAGYNLVVSSDGFYAVCDTNFKSLVKCNTLKGASWYINNMQTLKLNQSS